MQNICLKEKSGTADERMERSVVTADDVICFEPYTYKGKKEEVEEEAEKEEEEEE